MKISGVSFDVEAGPNYVTFTHDIVLSGKWKAIAGVRSDPKLKGDTLHPDAEGHARLAEKIFRELQSIGYAG